MSKGAKSLKLAEWRPWHPWHPWFGKVAKKVLSKLLLLLKGAKTANKNGHAREGSLGLCYCWDCKGKAIATVLDLDLSLAVDGATAAARVLNG